MAKQYNLAITVNADGSEKERTFSVTGADSFDEAEKLVQKGIHDYDLSKQPPPQTDAPVNDPSFPQDPQPQTGGLPGGPQGMATSETQST